MRETKKKNKDNNKDNNNNIIISSKLSDILDWISSGNIVDPVRI